MLINELSKRTGLSTHTIRFYERYGLVKGTRDTTKTSNNYFHYDEDAVEKLLLVRDAKSVGFTLSEIGELIDAWYNEKITIKDKLQILDNKLAEIDNKIKDMKNMRKLILEFKRSVETEEC
jgi:MerR family Zn(II)-responsive transcriptional regulator of zntA